MLRAVRYSQVLILLTFPSISYPDIEVYELSLHSPPKEISIVVHCAEGITDCNTDYISPTEDIDEEELTEFDTSVWRILIGSNRSGW